MNVKDFIFQFIYWLSHCATHYIHKSSFHRITHGFKCISMNVAFLCACLILTSCAMSGTTYRGDRNQAFINGEVVLDCFVSCSGRWGANVPDIKGLYDAKLWQQLASRIMDIGYGDNLSYFLLGRAAEELGYSAASQQYYRMSLAASKCDVIVSYNCHGIELPSAVHERLLAIESQSQFAEQSAAKLTEANSQYVSSNQLAKASHASGNERRIALVIGNSKYEYITRLENPKNDAQLIASTLRTLGFQLVGGKAMLDLDRVNMEVAIKRFSQEMQKDIESKPSNVIALFYYAGHGIQARGENFLVPVDANPTKEADFDFQLTNANIILRQMEHASTALNMVILDACRNNPLGVVGYRSSGNGLAEMKAPDGTLIAFSTQSGNVAQDGPSGGNSPFAKALNWGLRQPGLDQFGTFNKVAIRVKELTNGVQQPWMSSSPIEGEFSFVQDH